MGEHRIAIGGHLSTSDGFFAMGEIAYAMDATTFAFFTRNPRGGTAKAIDPEDAGRLLAFMDAHGFSRLVAHAPYTMNLCSDKPETREFALRVLSEDLQRMELLPGNLYNFHPGSHVGQGADKGIRLIIEALDEAVPDDCSTTVLLETMAGKGTEVGRTFEELSRIIEGARCSDKLGVCLDTCHVWDGGYDIVGNLDGVLDEFDRIVGLDRLKALHLNDSKNPLGAHKDRHERIGEGCIGIDAFAGIVTHPRLRDLPMILETPGGIDGYAAEIALLRGLAGEG